MCACRRTDSKGFGSKDVIGREVDQLGTRLPARFGKDPRTDRVYGIRPVGIVLRGIDGIVGGSVEDYPGASCLDCRPDRDRIRDVDLGPGNGDAVRHERSKVRAQLPARASDQSTHLEKPPGI